MVMDNRDVVPYNRALCKKYNVSSIVNWYFLIPSALSSCPT